MHFKLLKKKKTIFSSYFTRYFLCKQKKVLWFKIVCVTQPILYATCVERLTKLLIKIVNYILSAQFHRKLFFLESVLFCLEIFLSPWIIYYIVSGRTSAHVNAGYKIGTYNSVFL